MIEGHLGVRLVYLDRILCILMDLIVLDRVIFKIGVQMLLHHIVDWGSDAFTCANKDRFLEMYKVYTTIVGFLGSNYSNHVFCSKRCWIMVRVLFLYW